MHTCIDVLRLEYWKQYNHKAPKHGGLKTIEAKNERVLPCGVQSIYDYHYSMVAYQKLHNFVFG